MYRLATTRLAITLVLFTMVMACSPASDFHYADGSGGKIADYKGRYLLINYWAEWCKPCLQEIPELNEFAHQYSEKVAVLAVNWDGISGEQLQQQVEKLNIEVDIVIEDISPLLGQKKPQVLPTTYILDDKGKLIATLVGPQNIASLRKATGIN